MAHSNGVITAPVSFGDVNATIGTAHTDLASLCKDNNINQWAKYKPVPKNKINTPDEYDFNAGTWAANSTWWKGDVTRDVIPAGTTFLHVTNDYPAAWIKVCGIKYLGFTAKSDVLKIFNPAGNHWTIHAGGIFSENYTHIAPRGGSTNEWFRLTDFCGYWHNAHFAAFTDYQTGEGTIYVNVNDDGAKHQVCSLIDYAEGDSLNFNNLFSDIDNNAFFDVVVGSLSGSTLTLVNPTVTRSTTGGRKDVTVYMETLTTNTNYIGIYCAVISVSGTSYYVPLMQSGGDTPNFTFPVAPKARAFKSWWLSSAVANNMVAWLKNNYAGTYRQLVTNTGGSMGNGEMMYLKMTITNNTHSSYYVTKSSIKVEFAGRFNEGGGSVREVYYQFANGDGTAQHQTRFALRDDEQSKAAWDDEGGFTIPPVGSGMNEKTLYLAMYNIFNDSAGMVVTKGGTIYRVSVWLNKSNEQPSSVFGAMTESGKLNISVSAL